MSGARIDARFEGRLGDFRLDVSLQVPASGVTALVGPSGSGKTTVLRCIAGLTRLGGHMRFGDEVWQDGPRFTPPHRRAIGYVFQEPSLLAHLSVLGNLRFGYTRSRDRSKIGFDDVVSLLGVEPLLRRATHRLSGGERQRVAIARALLSQPELLLLDEPVSSLDADGKAEILPYLERLLRSLSIPMIYVSHDQSEIALISDRVVDIDAGRIVGASKFSTA